MAQTEGLNILGIIPARGGSKGIPHKNIIKLNGKPLIVHTIEAAKKSRLLNKIVVSTDDKKIATISKRHGIQVVHRPSKLAKDDTESVPVFIHAIKEIRQEDFEPDIIVILQPTSPLRKAKSIEKSIKLLRKSDATSIIAVSRIKTHPYASFVLEKKYLRPFKSNFEKYYQRQKYPDLYYPTGSIYTFWRDTIEKYNSIYGPRIKPLLVKEEEENIDIDNLYDLFISEMTMKYWKNFNRRFIH